MSLRRGIASGVRIALAGLALVALPAAGEDARPDADDFPVGTLRNVVRATSAPEEGDAVIGIAEAPGLRAVVTLTGTRRPLSRPTRRVLSAFVTAAGPQNEARARTFVAQFREEIEVEEAGRRYWVPMQRTLDESFRQEVGPSQEFTLACRYVGIAMPGPHPVCALVGYYFQPWIRPERTTCFASELAGVAIGAPIDEASRRLVAAHGEPVGQPRNGAQRIATYALDSGKTSVLVVADAGLGHHERVYSVQISGPPASALPVAKGLALGDPPEKVEAALGAPARKIELEGGVMRWEFARSPCTVAFHGGALVAAFVSDDPNYFAD